MEYHECGKGWEALILKAEALINDYNIRHPNEPQLEFTQIKEKWGGLRIYLNYYPEDIDDKLHTIEEESCTMCEHCGTTKNVSKEWTHGWIMTLCNKCRKKELEQYNQLFNKEEFLDYPYLGIGEKPDKASKYASEDKLEKMIL